MRRHYQAWHQFTPEQRAKASCAVSSGSYTRLQQLHRLGVFERAPVMSSPFPPRPRSALPTQHRRQPAAAAEGSGRQACGRRTPNSDFQGTFRRELAVGAAAAAPRQRSRLQRDTVRTKELPSGGATGQPCAPAVTPGPEGMRSGSGLQQQLVCPKKKPWRSASVARRPSLRLTRSPLAPHAHRTHRPLSNSQHLHAVLCSSSRDLGSSSGVSSGSSSDGDSCEELRWWRHQGVQHGGASVMGVRGAGQGHRTADEAGAMSSECESSASGSIDGLFCSIVSDDAADGSGIILGAGSGDEAAAVMRKAAQRRVWHVASPAKSARELRARRARSRSDMISEPYSPERRKLCGRTSLIAQQDLVVAARLPHWKY